MRTICQEIHEIHQNNPEFFTEEVYVSLDNLLPNLPNDPKERSDVIAIWAKEYPQIYKELVKISSRANNAVRGIGGVKSPQTPDKDKELLENIVRPYRDKRPSKDK